MTTDQFIEDTRRAWHLREELELCAADNEQHFTCSDLLKVVRRGVLHGLTLAKEAVFKPNPAPADGKWCCEGCPKRHQGEMGAVTKTLKNIDSLISSL